MQPQKNTPMKTLRPFFFLAALVILVIQPGCATLEKLVYNHIRATVNNQNFSTTVVEGTAVAGYITLAGSSTTGSQVITIVVPQSIKPGTYKLSSIGSYKIEYKAANNSVYAASSGELIILSHDVVNKKINGTFHFKGLNLSSASVDVTAGNFTVSYF